MLFFEIKKTGREKWFSFPVLYGRPKYVTA